MVLRVLQRAVRIFCDSEFPVESRRLPVAAVAAHRGAMRVSLANFPSYRLRSSNGTNPKTSMRCSTLLLIRNCAVN